MTRTALAAVLGGLVLMAAAPAAGQPSPASLPSALPTPASLAARLSDGATAMEYWDVTAWLDSGERAFVRFLVTNQGPGVRTAAAVGHLVLADGTVLPFQWGRRHGDWTLGPGGSSMKIAKARLDLANADGRAVLQIDSAKHGVEIRLEIGRATPLVAAERHADYGLDAAMPAATHGRVRTRGSVAFRPVVGSAAITHTWMERPEGELVQRRFEAFARTGELATYLSAVVLSDGTSRGVAVASRGNAIVAHADDVAFAFDGPTRDPRYPVARQWHATSTTIDARTTITRELLRMDPLEILPQPFRTLLALGGKPQRVWADGTLELTVKNGNESPRAPTTFQHAVVAATFARPN